MGLLYVEMLKEEDTVKKTKLKAKIEEKTRQLLQEEKLTFIESVIKTDSEYKDKVFWLSENGKNITMDTIKNMTLGWALEFEKRLIKKLTPKND
jgi:hypothetical protein